MAGAPKEQLQTLTSEEAEESTEEMSEQREVFLRDGRKLVVSDQGADQLVEVRNPSGMLELRIRLTEEGPVLQMESARLQLKATEAVEIESPRVAIQGTEQVEVRGGQVRVHGEEGLEVESQGDVRVVGKMIYLN